jgi:ABC-type transport system involved in multi-copper enzyme maturation permease subunit
VTTATVAPMPDRVQASGWRPARLTDVLVSEWTKVRTLRSTFYTLLATVALVVGLGALISYESAVNLTGLEALTWDPTAVSLAGLVIGQLTLAAFGVMVVTGEYSSGMIRTTLAAVPRRGRLLAAKATVVAIVVLVLGEVISWSAFSAGQAVISGHAATASVSDPGVARAVAGAGLYLALVAVMSLAIGTLLRHTAGSIVTVVAILFVLPAIVQALPASWRNPVEEYWPTQAGSQILTVVRGDHTLAPWWGLGEFALFVAILLGLAYWRLARTDA